MWLALGVLFVVGWLLLKLFWGVASLAVHLLLAAAALVIIIHFVRGRFSHDRQGVGT